MKEVNKLKNQELVDDVVKLVAKQNALMSSAAVVKAITSSSRIRIYQTDDRPV